MKDFDSTLTADEVAAARALMLALEPFRQIRTTMPLQYLYTFCLVCTEEGLGVTEYAQKAEVPVTVMTRHLLDIGDRNRNKEAGFGLITQERDLHDLRRHHARVTPTGKTTLGKILRALKTAPK